MTWPFILLAALAIFCAVCVLASCMLSSRLSREEEAAAMQTEAVAATRTHPVGCCCNECEDRMAQMYDGFGRPNKPQPVDMNAFLDSQCLEIRRLPEQTKEAV